MLVITTGVTLSMHYCGGKLVSTAINKKAKSCCDGTGGCCENKTIHIQLKEDFDSQTNFIHTEVAELDVLFPVLFLVDLNLLEEPKDSFIVYQDSSPPPNIQTRLSLLQTYLC